MEVHELCRLFPEMTKEEFADLCLDIAKHGIRQPVIVHEGKIIDGRHRDRAGLLLGVDIPYQEWDGVGSLLDFVVSCNARRRNLTPGQLAAIGVEVKQRKEEEYRERQLAGLKKGNKAHEPRLAINCQTGSSRKEAAALMGVNHQYISDAERIQEASPETFESVRRGETTIPQAKRELGIGKPKPHVPDDTLGFDADDDRLEFVEDCLAKAKVMKSGCVKHKGLEEVASAIDHLINKLKLAAV